MSFDLPDTPAGSATGRGPLPGRPHPFFLARGEGEHSKVFADVQTVLLSGDETAGQFGIFTNTCPPGPMIPTHLHHDTHETFLVVEGAVRVFVQLPDGEKVSRLLEDGDFGFVPAGAAHAYQVERAAHIVGVATGGFERFFQQLGARTETGSLDGPPVIPDRSRMQAAAQAHRMEFLPDFDWTGR